MVSHVDAVYGVKGLRSLKDQLSIGLTYSTGKLVGTCGQKGTDSRDRYHTVVDCLYSSNYVCLSYAVQKNRSFLNKILLAEPAVRLKSRAVAILARLNKSRGRAPGHSI